MRIVINRILFFLVAIFGAILFVSSDASAFNTSLYADTSRLATGKWVRIKVTESGIYSISASDVRAWGLSSLANIRIFGYGGAPLPEKLVSATPDDLPQVPVLRTDSRVLFYAQGPLTWTTSSYFKYRQVQHPYATSAYYFVTDDAGIPDSTVGKASNSLGGGEEVNTFVERLYHEEELVNPGQTGRVLLGEDFRYNTTQTFKFTLDGLVANSEVSVLTNFVAKSMAGGSNKLTFKYNGNNLSSSSSDNISAATSLAHDHYNSASTIKRFTLSGTNELNYSITFTPSGTLYLARLNYIAVNYTRSLALSGGKLAFGQLADSPSLVYNLANASSASHVWDVTTPHKPVEMNATLSGTTARFSPAEAGQHEYYAFDESASFPSPAFDAAIANQNIHGEPTPDMIIISPAEFLAQAQRVADLHTSVDSMRVLVVDQKDVFNEFSSGTPDAMAYRRLCKMFYDRGADAAGHKLGYLLLMGNASFDNRQLTSTVKAIAYPMLLSWQSEESSNENSSYTSDDIFVVLDDNSGPQFERSDMNIAVGRFPVKSVAEARTAVNKLIKYVTKPDYGDWKTNVLNVADDEDSGIHMEQADNVISTARQHNGDDFLFNRVFIDAFTSQSLGAGRNYPDARAKMFRKLNEGVAWWNYTGHASPNLWTADGLLTSTDINTNLFYSHLPILYAATCEFARFDAIELSGGENMFLNNRGGAIAVICPARLVFIPNNGILNASVAKYIFARDANGLPLRIGDIVRLGKNDTGSDDNNSRYMLLGDPAMRPAYPTRRIAIETIDGKEVDPDNMPVFKARQTITFTGNVLNTNGNTDTKFNGSVISTLFDAEQTVTTHGYGEQGKEYSYNDRQNKLAVTIDSVVNGKFSIKVTIPSEVVATYDNYTPALINLYAYSPADSIEAMGSNSNFYIYGYDDDVKADTIGPDISYFGLNSESFADGDNVNESPLVLATISDDTGINFSTGGIGHSMTLTLDDKTTYSNVSSYYQPSYSSQGTSGSLTYELSDLAEGKHTLKLKVWDVYSNSSEKTISFNVIKGLKPSIVDVYSDANPATVEANFYVRHNRPDALLNVTIEVFDLMGRPVWSATQTGRSDMFTSFPITWDLCNSGGARVQRGIYIYRATISTDGKQQASKAKKIAVAGQF